MSSLAPSRGLALGTSSDAQLVLTRFADEAPAPPRRVGYRLREGTVEYLLWPPGPGADSQPAARPVLANVAEMRLSARNVHQMQATATSTPPTAPPISDPGDACSVSAVVPTASTHHDRSPYIISHA